MELQVMKFGRFGLSTRNQLFQDSSSIMLSEGLEKLKIVKEYDEFIKHLGFETDALNKEKGSQISKSVRDKRILLNQRWTGFYNVVIGSQFSPNDQVAQAAQSLYYRIEQFDDPTASSIADETNLFSKICTELNFSLRNLVEILGLVEWVDTIKQLNEEFQQLLLRRNDELAGRNQISASSLRPATDAAFAAIVKRINALITINGEADYAVYVAKQNQLFTKYLQSLNIQAGKSAASRDKKSKENEAQ